MPDIKRILCPVDFSEFSRHALEHAATLAGQHGARVTVLHVAVAVPPSIALSGLAGYVPPAPAGAPGDLVQQVREFCAGILPVSDASVEITVLPGNPAREIVRLAERMPADLLVLGTHGRGGFERFFLGSVTEKVLKNAGVPVLTVPPATARPARTEYTTVLCPIDLSDASAAAVDAAASVARPTSARLILLHVIEPYPDLVQAAGSLHVSANDRQRIEAEVLRRLAEAIPEQARRQVKHEERVAFGGKASTEIIRVAGEVRADIIVMAMQGRDAVDRWVFGSTIPRVVREATCPVLTLRA